MNKLEILIISRSNINSHQIKLRFRNKLDSIKSIDLSYNNIDQIDEKCFYGLFSLESLNISSNRITFLEPRLFNELDAIKSIDLSYNSIKHIDIKSFDGILNLETLNISQNRINSHEKKLIESFFRNAKYTNNS